MGTLKTAAHQLI